MGYDTRAFMGELEAAGGKLPLDVKLENVKLVNVYTNEILPCSIGIYNEKVVSIDPPSEQEARQSIDGNGQYALPGFIDAHVHIETTLLTPEALGEVIAPWGSTSLCIDAMEIANVAGIEGLTSLIRDSDKLPFRMLIEVPSRVPTAPGLETTGGVLGVKEVRQLLKLSETVSLGELDPSKILEIREEYLEKILAAINCGKICNGHAIGLTKAQLNVYAAAHLTDDHESVSFEELLDRLRLGIAPLIREGSSERNVEELIKGVVSHGLSTENMMFCTDDKHVNDIEKEGHISYNVQKSIDLGLDPIDAIKMATINTAKHFRIEHLLGSLSPGRYADIILLEDLKQITPSLVLKGGRIAAENGKATACPSKEYPKQLFFTVKLKKEITPDSFGIPTSGKRAKCRVISLIKDQIINKEMPEWMEVCQGEIYSDTVRDIIKLAVVERYGKTGGVTTGLVHGFSLARGALASSVSHDHHNIVVAGVSEQDMACAVNEAARLQGGFVFAADGEVIASIALPLGGLMSTLSAKETLDKMNELNETVFRYGCKLKAPFMTLSFISLPTVPELGMTDLGLIDVKNHSFTNLIIEEELL